MAKKIIVGTDFSSHSKEAFRFALEIAANKKHSLLLYHAWSIPPVEQEFSREAREKKYRKDQEQKLQKLKTLADAAEKKGVKCDIVIEDNDFPEGLIAIAEKENAIMAVIGTKGLGEIEAFFVGSSATKAIDKTKLPLLLVPLKTKPRPIKTVALSVDHGMDELMEFGMISQLMEKDGTIQYLHISTGEQTDIPEEVRLKKELAPLTKKLRGKFEYIIVTDPDIIEGINLVAARYQPDVIAMIRTNKSMLDKFFWGSLTRRMAFVSRQPLLVIPAPDKSQHSL